eukprot:scaffold218_cov333-Prasinococcus_capsulatus_cf.AAC.1
MSCSDAVAGGWRRYRFCARVPTVGPRRRSPPSPPGQQATHRAAGPDLPKCQDRPAAPRRAAPRNLRRNCARPCAGPFLAQAGPRRAGPAP